jgi:hypothetical protein
MSNTLTISSQYYSIYENAYRDDISKLWADLPVIVDNEYPDKLRMTDQSLIAVMVNAIKDQQKIIETLESRITSLEA